MHWLGSCKYGDGLPEYLVSPSSSTVFRSLSISVSGIDGVLTEFSRVGVNEMVSIKGIWVIPE